MIFRKFSVFMGILLRNFTPGAQDVQSAREYAAELKIRLTEVFIHVTMQLNLTRQQMQKQHNKNIFV